MTDIHTMPSDGPEHQESEECWCCPILIYVDIETGVHQWLHNDTRPGGVN